MAETEDRELIAELARAQVAQLAPDELPLFRPTCEAFFKDPRDTLKTRAGKDEMLGFGTGAALTFLTPVVLAVTTEVVRFLIEEIQKSVKAQSSEVISQTVRRLFRSFRGGDAQPAGPPPLTAEQLERVRRLAAEKAKQLNLGEDQAGLLADSIVGSLVVAS